MSARNANDILLEFLKPSSECRVAGNDDIIEFQLNRNEYFHRINYCMKIINKNSFENRHAEKRLLTKICIQTIDSHFCWCFLCIPSIFKCDCNRFVWIYAYSILLIIIEFHLFSIF